VSDRRRFNKGERAVLYAESGGRCAGCGTPLRRGWHADHVIPHSKGGPTRPRNGAALCPSCNLKKGNGSLVNEFRLRQFQADLAERVVARHHQGEKVTVAYVAPGGGKTIAVQAAAAALSESLGGALPVVWFAPRRNLLKQAEDSWAKRSVHFRRLSSCLSVPDNRDPLVDPEHAGYVSTYQSLTTNPGIHTRWAHAHAGRFVLALDEAHWLGFDPRSEKYEGTKAARIVADLMDQAGHVIVMTGTAYRADGQQAIGCRYVTRDDGRLVLDADVSSTYLDGVSGGGDLPWLRPIEGSLEQYDVQFDDDSDRLGLDAYQGAMRPIVRTPELQERISARVVDYLRKRQQLDRRYAALVACDSQDDARAVQRVVQRIAPDLKVVRAISDDGPEAQRALESFREDHGGDVLVTVGMAYVGYDCPRLTVIGILTATRWEGWLKQLVARGLRVWDARDYREQLCLLALPNDRRARDFLDALRTESEAGMRQRQERDGGERGPATKARSVTLDHLGRVVIGMTDEEDILDRDEIAFYETVAADAGVDFLPVTTMASIERAFKRGPAIESSGTATATVVETGTEEESRLRAQIADAFDRYWTVEHGRDYGAKPAASQTFYRMLHAESGRRWKFGGGRMVLADLRYCAKLADLIADRHR